MKINAINVDDLNRELTIEIAAEDYAEAERKKLAECRRNAEFKGFRKGMVPSSLIKKVYGGQALAEAVNQVLSEQLQKYISDNKLNVLGEPLTSEKQPELDWTDGNGFTFIFDLGLSPEVKVEVEKTDAVDKYDISIAASDKKNWVENMKKFYAEQASKEEGEKAPAKTDDEIEKEVVERMQGQLSQQAEWKLVSDIKKYFVEKAAVRLPEDFLKRWLVEANKEKVSKEDVEKEFPGFLEDFKWQLVRGSLLRKFDIKIESKDIQESAESFVRSQYAMYGMPEVPAELIKDAAQNMMKDRAQIERIVEQVEDEKVLSRIRETISIKDKKITSAKFRELK